MKLDNPLLVRWEYASEERLAKRNAVLRALSQGATPEDAAFEAVAAVQPKRILDIGCGLGEMGERFRLELGAHVCAIDTSERMVELAKERGVDAQLADAERLPFPDEDFDRRVPDLLDALRPGDLLIITSDHGCDPTTPSTDHSREHAMLLAYVAGRNASGQVHEGEFADVGATVNAWLKGKAPSRGIPGQPILTP